MTNSALKLTMTLALFAVVSACTGGYTTVRYGGHYGHGYHGYYDYGPWGGYRDPIIVVPPDVDDDLVAMPLPEPPPDIGLPDFDMPDVDLGGFD